MNNSLILGVDIGGSHITAALIDIEKSKLLPDTLVRKDVNSHTGTEEIVNVWTDVMREACSAYELPQIQVGIAIPGPFDYENGICKIKGQDKYEALYGLNIKTLLGEKLEIKPDNIRLLNDAGAFLQGEVFAGAGQGFRNVIGVTLGTGLGTSRYDNGIASDANLWCVSFLGSIAEDYLSTRWFVKRYKEVADIFVPDVKALSDLVYTDEKAMAVFEEFGHNFGLFLSYFIHLDKPEMVVLGGNIANAADLFMPQTEKVLTGQQKQVIIKNAKLGEKSTLIGAASIWHKAMSELSPLLNTV